LAVDKNFVVKNGLEVDTNLIFADANRNQVGIATTVTNFTFQVLGGVGVTNITISNLATVLSHLRVGTTGTSFTVLASNNNVGIRTATPIFPLDIRSPVSAGQTALYVQGDAKITGLLDVETVDFNSAVLASLTVNDALVVNSPAVSQLNGYVDINNSVDVSGNLNVTGISTLGGRININNSAVVGNNLRVSGIVTAGSVSIGNTEVISSERQLKNIVSFDATTIDSIETVIANSPNTFTDMSVSGISTFGTVLVSSGVITARSGVVTYFGDGAYLNNTLRGIGIGTVAGLVGYGISFINFAGPVISTCFVSATTGIATVYFEDVGPTIGIGTTPGEAGFFGQPDIGNLWYNTNYGRLFLYYSDGDSSQWVDASPSNTGIITSLSNISFYRGSASSPSVYIVDDNQTGVFSPGPRQITFVSAGSSILNINNNGIRVTGVSTFNNTVVGGSTTALVVNGDVRVTGVSTFNNTVVGGSTTALTVNGDVRVTGVSTFNNTVVGGSTTALTVNGDVRVTGVSTFNNTVVGGSTTALVVNGDTRISGALTASNLTVSTVTNLNQITETVVNGFTTSLSPSAGTLTIDTSLGTVFLGDLDASVTTWAFTNVPTANGKATTITVIIDGDTAQTYGDACSVNGSSISGGIKWNGGSTPTATNNYDLITFSIVRDNSGTVIVFGSSDMNYS
jgi:hypothetical protein